MAVRMERAGRTAKYAGTLALLMILAADPQQAWSETAVTTAVGNDAATCDLVKGPQRAVVAIIDPQTVRLDDGTELRLIGLLAPISLSGKVDRWPPTLAAQAALEGLLAGQSVELGYDKQRRNRYGQVLAQVYRLDGNERVWIQKKMIEAGHARVAGSRENNECLGDLLAAEQRARAASRGIWSHAAFQIRPAWRTRELLRYRQNFELVEGEVRAVARAGNSTYLNFGRRWQEDFTVAIRGRDRRAFERAGLDLERLEGKRIRVRGWIEKRNGPLVEATHPAQIEIVGRKSDTRATQRQRRLRNKKNPDTVAQ